VNALEHPDEDVVLFSTQILGHVADTCVSEHLLRLLDHENKNIAQAAMEGLGKVKEVRAIPHLLDKLETDMWLQLGSLEALGDIGDESVVEPLLKHLDDDMLGPLVIEALRKIASPKALLPLFEMFVRDNRLPSRDEVVVAVAAILRNGKDGSDNAVASVRVLYENTLNKAEVEEYMTGSLSMGSDEVKLAVMEIGPALQVKKIKPHVVNALGSVEDPKAGREAVLRWGNEMASELEAGLKSDDATVVKECALCLGRLRSEESRERLLDALKHPSTSVQLSVLEALSRLSPSTENVVRIVPMLTIPHLEIREGAVKVLAGLGREGVERVKRHMASFKDDHNYFMSLLRLIGAVGDPEDKAFVTQYLSHPDKEVRKQALQAVAAYPAASQDIISCLNDSSIEVRICAIALLGELKTREAVDELLKRLDSKEEQLYFIVRSLGQIGDEKAIDQLLVLFPETSMKVQVEILDALGKLRSPEAKAFLERKIAEADLEIRRTAVASLGEYRDSENADLFIRLLEDKDWFIRKSAAWALGEVGAAGALEHLSRLENDAEPIVARSAKAAREKISNIQKVS
jgi:HEAT repeat protein